MLKGLRIKGDNRQTEAQLKITKSTLEATPAVCGTSSMGGFYLPGILLTLLGPQSHLGGKSLGIWIVCPQIGTAVLKGLIPIVGLVPCYPVWRLRPPFLNHAPPPERMRQPINTKQTKQARHPPASQDSFHNKDMQEDRKKVTIRKSRKIKARKEGENKGRSRSDQLQQSSRRHV